MTKRIIRILLAFLSIIGIGNAAEKITKKDIIPNPTDYVFARPFDQVVDVVKNLTKTSKRFKGFFQVPLRSSPENGEFGMEFLTPAEKINIYPIYFQGDKPLDYFATLRVIVKQQGLETKVVVAAVNAVISKPGHGFNVHTFRFDQGTAISVASTTIEEYEILLEIGRLLNQSNMPELNFPK